MAAGDITQGRRVAKLEPHEYEPGDFGKYGDVWFVRCPSTKDGELHLFTGNLANHNVIEHEDGTITVSPSILVTSRWAGEERQWHGFLERGVWREV